MAVSKLIIFLMISMAFVLSVRCQDEFNEEIEAGVVEMNENTDLVNTTATPGKKGIASCVKEKVKKVVERGKQVLSAARDAISKGYSDFKNKAKEIIGKKQPDAFSSSTPSDLDLSPSESYPLPPSSSGPSAQYPLPSSTNNQQQYSRSDSTTEDQFEMIDPRQTFHK